MLEEEKRRGKETKQLPKDIYGKTKMERNPKEKGEVRKKKGTKENPGLITENLGKTIKNGKNETKSLSRVK